MSWWWSYLLMAVGVFGLWLAGRKSVWGWAVGLGAQVLWVAYALVTVQYGFVISAVAYGAVYLKNYLTWRVADGLRPIRCWWGLHDNHELSVHLKSWGHSRTVEHCNRCGWVQLIEQKGEWATPFVSDYYLDHEVIDACIGR